MGTSVEMIEQHYSHLKVKDAVPQLKGAKTRGLLKIKSMSSLSPLYISKNKQQIQEERRLKLQEAGRKSGVVRRAKKQKNNS
jgi:hypothetical protein